MNYFRKNQIGRIIIFLLSFFLFTSFIYAATWTNDSQVTFDEGDYNNTEFDTDSVKLKEWSDTEKELPHNGITDLWGIDMSGNVLLMHMNEDSGAIEDYSGNGNSGTYNGSLYSQGGQLNTSIGFSGDNDSINVGNESSLDLVANLTISTWLKPTAYVNDGVILGKPHTSQANPYVTYAIGYSSNGQNYGLALGNASTQRGCYTDDNTVILNEWTHFTSTFNGTEIKLYINGELNKSCAFSYFEINQNSADILLGDYPYFDNTYDYSGDIDELAIYNRTLSAQGIKNIYNRQAKKYGGNNSGDYISKILDSQGISKWETISWITEIPYGQELPTNQAIETGNFLRGMDMTGNIGLWHFNEISGDIIDYSGNGNDGTVHGGVSYGTGGKLNTALEFDGIDGYVQIPNAPSLNPTDEITLLAWVKWNINPTLGSNYASIINKNVDNQYRLHHNNSNEKFEFAIRTTPNGNRWVDSTTSPQEGVWYFLAGTYNGSILKIYINGVLENTNNHGGTLLTSTNDVNIGRRSSNDRYFDGIIDEAAIFGRVLSEQEIEDIYKRGALKLGLNIRSCDDSSCAGESWSDLGNDLVSPQSLATDDNQFFEYKFDFETEDADLTPQLYEVSVDYNTPPDKPVNTTPVDLASNTGLNPELTASVFFDHESNGHIDTEWKVDNDSDFSSPVWARTAGTGEHQTTIDNTSGTFTNELSGKAELEYGTTYYWQVRYKDDGSGNWSNWSNTTAFTTFNQYIVRYDGNGNTGGTVPPPQSKNHGVDLTLQSNTGSLSKTGYSFTGWNIALDGSGTHYGEGGNFTTDADTTLYADWTIVSSGGGGLPPIAYEHPQATTILPTVFLNEGADTTEKRIINVELKNYESLFPAVDRYSISDNEAFEGASIEKLADYEKNGLKWDLCQNQEECQAGNYTVYVKFYTQWGRSSEFIQSSIGLEEDSESEGKEKVENFTDTKDHWAEEYIKDLYEKGYIQGYADGKFLPDRAITRAEASKLIAMWMGGEIEESDCDKEYFKDVSCEEWYGKFIGYLTRKGVLEGYGEGLFGPERPITRAEALKVMIYAKGLQDTEIEGMENSFTDIGESAWYYNVIMIGYKLSIVQGYEDKTFRPQAEITRAEFAKIFSETLL